VVSCQIYGDYSKKTKEGQKDKDYNLEKQNDIKLLLKLYPHLRIAYIENVPGLDRDDPRNNKTSVLLRYDPSAEEVIEIYRVKLPGNFLVGEGKPENQNHAIIFTRGEYLQTLDMNQDGYFEEALKMRNLLQEFEEDPRVRIVGFPEHQFTAALSTTAEFAALTEFAFATMIQRTLGCPFDVRMHYGHPDVFDRVFHVARGGVAKANKVLCISEDIFGGFNSVLKGGRNIFREYIKVGKGKDLGFEQTYIFESKISGGNGEQALSRDFWRLCAEMDLPRLLSFFHSANGFYWSNLFVIWATNWFLYSQLFLSILVPTADQSSLISVTQTLAFTVQLGVVLTLPLLGELVLEKGLKESVFTMVRVLLTGGPLFFMFHIRTKAYYYDTTLILGGAKYKSTGRGFILAHTDFVTTFRMFKASHYSYGATLIGSLVVYRIFIVDPELYLSVTWPTWLFALDMLFAPLFFNFQAFDHAKILEDLHNWHSFMSMRSDDPTKSWHAFFEAESDLFANADAWQRLNLILRNIVWLILAVLICLNKFVLLDVPNTEGAAVVPLLMLAAVLVYSRRDSRYLRSHMWRRFLLVLAGGTAAASLVLLCLFATPFQLLATFISVFGYA
jgi:callose synthase